MSAAFWEQLNQQQKSLLYLLATKGEDDDTSVPTLAQELNFKTPRGLRYHLPSLEASGLVRWPQTRGTNAHLLRLTQKGRELLEENPPTLTIFEGGVHAGACGVQYEAEALEIQKLEQLLALYGAHYALKIKGNCMDGGRTPIVEGDRVLVRAEAPKNGKIVHVELPITVGENEPLLREYSFDEETNLVTLTCYNPTPDEAATMTYDAIEVDVRGVVKTILHDI